MDIFRDPTKMVPTQDRQIVRVDMDEQQIGGRLSHLPAKESNGMGIDHVPNADGKK
jgi:hypothetical protein